MKIYLKRIQTFINFVNTTNTGYGLINVDDLLDLKDIAFYYLENAQEREKLTEEKIDEYCEISNVFLKIMSNISQFLSAREQYDRELESIGQSYTGEFAKNNVQFFEPYYDEGTNRHVYSSKDMECNPIATKLDRITENLKSEIEEMIDEELAQPLNLGEGNTFKTIRDCMAYYRKSRKQKEKQEGMSTK